MINTFKGRIPGRQNNCLIFPFTSLISPSEISAPFSDKLKHTASAALNVISAVEMVSLNIHVESSSEMVDPSISKSTSFRYENRSVT